MQMVVGLLFIAIPVSTEEQPKRTDNSNLQFQVRKTIEKSLPYVEKNGVAWITEQKCVSCHQISSMLWCFNEAKAQKIEVNPKKQTEWTDWSLEFCVNERDKKTKKRTGGGLDTMVQVILGRDRSADHEKRMKVFSDLADLIVRDQLKDGSWKPAGQLPLQRRPKRETTEVTTMWAALALAALPDEKETWTASRKRAAAWLKDIKGAQSTEWWAVRYLFERRFGNREKADKLLRALIAKQNSDGGWGWLTNEKSDALGTGNALYALGVAGLDADHPAVKRAWSFLVKTQRADGSWAVPDTRTRKKGRITDCACYWGTAWAVIGLAKTLETGPSPEYAPIATRALPSQKAGKKKSPHIKHTVKKIEGWTVHVDPQLLKGDGAETGRVALRILSNHLFRLALTLSKDQIAKLRQVPIFLDHKHPLGNLQYHPSVGWLKSNGHDPAMKKAVHIPQAKRLILLQKSNQQPWVILHEMAHAYHDRVLGFDEKTIRNAYDNAKKSGLYQSVLLIHGQKRRHYALTNHKEYFAELTEAYFGTNDFFPFVYSELRDYDAEGFAMLQKIWGKRR